MMFFISSSRGATSRKPPTNLFKEKKSMTKTEICNRALAVLGHDRVIADYDGQTGGQYNDNSTEAMRCRQFYPAALRNVLSAYNWDFASTEVTISFSSASHTWAIPDGLVKLVSVMDAFGRSVRAIRYGATLTIFNPDANGVACSVTIRYVTVADPTGFTVEATLPHLVAEAVVYELAALLFGPMIGNVQSQDGTALFESYAKLAAQKLSAAITAEDSEHAFMGGNRSANAAAKTDLVNRAIAKLGGDAIIMDLDTDPSPIAARARLFFRSSLLAVLKRRDWDFAAAECRVVLSWDDRNGYARVNLPDDCVKICSVFDDLGHPLECRRNRDFFFVRSNGGAATLRYISSEVELDGLPEAFLDLVALDLAVKLAPTVLQDAKTVANMTQSLEAQIHALGYEDANDTAKPGEWQNPFIAARR